MAVPSNFKEASMNSIMLKINYLPIYEPPFRKIDEGNFVKLSDVLEMDKTTFSI